ncbi:MAG: carboxypeptidase-like regulatory domain-containing protein, partial [Ferruginibacter sp.]
MKSFLTLFTGLVFFIIPVFAQNRIVSGKVTDDKGDPISGASIILKGTTRGTLADASGNFQISVSKGDVIQISAGNFENAEATIGSANQVFVLLKPYHNVLEEVVVTALGQTTQKAKLGYSTATFNSEEINRTANVNAFDALAGKIAGAEISNTGGPGSSTKVILRGYGVIAGGSNQPLYV